MGPKVSVERTWGWFWWRKKLFFSSYVSQIFVNSESYWLWRRGDWASANSKTKKSRWASLSVAISRTACQQLASEDLRMLKNEELEFPFAKELSDPARLPVCRRSSLCSGFSAQTPSSKWSWISSVGQQDECVCTLTWPTEPKSAASSNERSCCELWAVFSQTSCARIK